jgi:hypothetical protein
VSDTLSPSGFDASVPGAPLVTASSSCYILDDALRVAEAWSYARKLVLADTATVGEAWTDARKLTFTESATLAETYTGTRASILNDALSASEAYTPVGHPVAVLTEALRATESYPAARAYLLEDELTVGETYGPSRADRLSDALHASEAYSPLATHAYTLADALTASEAYKGTRSTTLADVLTAGEAWRVRRGCVLADAGALTEAYAPRANARVLLADAGRLAESWTVFNQPAAALADVLYGDDAYLLPGDGTGAWTAGTDTWGMSRYGSWPINSMAVIGGVRYGATADGLVVCNAPSDDTGTISAKFTTGLDQLGNDSTKRLRMVHAVAKVEVPNKAPYALAVTVRDVASGHVNENTYGFEIRPGDDLAPQRAKFGRGAKSRAFQFTIANYAGADFTFESASIIVDSGSRRV